MSPEPSDTVNVAARLTAVAEAMPESIAVVEPLGYDRGGKRQYRHVTFRELDQDSDRIAGGLRGLGVTPGTRLALLVRPGIDFISLVFALFKAGVVVILIDPGMGRRNLLRCLADAEPEGFIAIPVVHAIRTLLRGRFPKAHYNVTVGWRWFWGGPTLAQLRRGPWTPSESTSTEADDPAAVIFTTGSTGPPKGVLYRHGNFDAQVDQIRDFYAIQPGEIDLPAFPLFGLFNCAMGVTAVIPDMDPSRPAQVDPRKIVEAIEDWQVTQTFGSPAIWNRVGQYCRQKGVRLPTVRRVLSAGAPVPADVLARMKAVIHPQGDVHTPYGATEALPVASIAAAEVLGDPNRPPAAGTAAPTRLAAAGTAANEPSAAGTAASECLAAAGTAASECLAAAGTAAQTAQGAGVCVGRRFPGIKWRVIRIVDGPIGAIAETEELPPGEIGELIVRGPQVTREYCTRREANCLGKIPDEVAVWHRMGDSGHFDDQGRFWFCGRVAHRVLTAAGPMYPVCCEAIFNRHESIDRSALVGIGPAGRQRPVIVLEPIKGRMPRSPRAAEALLNEVRQLGRGNPLTAAIDDFLLHPAFPVDIRHNAKIFREELAVWAAKKL